MKISALFIALFTVSLGVNAVASEASVFPKSAVRFLVPYPPGGSSDAVARVIAKGLSEEWKQPVVIENRPGAQTVIAMTSLAQAKPDGYTLGLITPTLAVNATLFPNAPYDAVKSFQPLGTFAQNYAVLAVNPKTGVNDIKGLQRYAGEEGREVRFAAGHSIGVINSYLLLKKMGFKATLIPYNGSTPAIQGVITSGLDFIYDSVVSMRPAIESGKLTAIASLGDVRSPSMPSVATTDEQGLDWPYRSWSGLGGPAGMSPELVSRISESLSRVLSSKDIQEQLKRLDVIPFESSPEELKKSIAAEIELYREVIMENNIPINK